MEGIEHAKSVIESDHRPQINGLDKSIRWEPRDMVSLHYSFLAHSAHQFAAYAYWRCLLLSPMA